MVMAEAEDPAAPMGSAMTLAVEAMDTVLTAHHAVEDLDYPVSTVRVNSFFSTLQSSYPPDSVLLSCP